MNKAIYLPIILQLIGVVVVIAEIIIPSGGILAILATGAFGYSLYLVFANYSVSAGLGFVIGDLILIPVLVYFGIKFLARSPVTLNKKLSRVEGVTSQSETLDTYMGQTGSAITDLRPSGMARIGEDRVDVVTRGEYLAKQTKIVVIAVTGNQIVVKENN